MANARPLDDATLARLREDLAAGKRPSLVLLRGGAGLAAGSRGQLVRIDDPPQDAEFLHVKVGHDELPFAPEELGLPGRRGRTAGGSTETAGSPGSAPNGSTAAGPARNGRTSASRPAPAASTRTSAPQPESASPRPPEPILEPVRPDRRTRAQRVVAPPTTPAEPAVPEADPTVAERPADSATADAATASRARTRRAARPGGPGKITLTLRFADFGWTVESIVGGRRDKPQPVPLAAIRAFADQLDDQSLRRQLDATVEACREEARKKATALREELARLETELAALDD